MKEDEDIEDHFDKVESIKSEMAEKELGVAIIYTSRIMAQKDKI